jgi:hypothetical protein
LKYQYLSTYFGSDPQILNLCENLLCSTKSQRAALLDINRAVRVLGDSIRIDTLTETLRKKYPGITEYYDYQPQPYEQPYMKRLKSGRATWQEIEIAALKIGYKVKKGRGLFVGVFATDVHGKSREFKSTKFLTDFLLSEANALSDYVD